MRSRTACNIYPCKLCPAAAAAASTLIISSGVNRTVFAENLARYLALLARFAYDIGDCDGGLISHIRQYAEILKQPRYADCAQETEQLFALCDLLEKSANKSIYE